MGFEGKKIIRLKFEDSDLDGLEVTTRVPTIEQVLAAGEQTDTDNPVTGLVATATLLIACLVGWNLENDGQPVPHTVEALLSQDADVTQGIIRAWEESAIRLGPKAKEPSSDGLRSVEASLPMEALSPSLAS